MNEIKRYEIYLGALLHDIGKFFQRADEKNYEDSKETEKSLSIVDYICPSNYKGRPSHHHVIWTHSFMESHKELFKKAGFKENKEDNLINYAMYHHRPRNIEEKIIQIADCWSSGMDRHKDYESFTETNYANYKDIRLMSIFGDLTVNNKSTENIKYQVKQKPLSLKKDAIFPEEIGKQNGVADYKLLWEDFIKDINLLEKESLTIETLCETILYILKKHTWCVTSSASKSDLPDVSLYDHLKTTAAISQCLYDYLIEQKPENKNLSEIKIEDIINDKNYPLLLFCADLSGIQKYIYNVASAKAAKALKGRSFYLQLLIDSVIEKIIKECNATKGHVIYSSGGKFYMLLPNTSFIKEKLAKIEKDLLKKLYEEHHGELYICMDYVKFGYDKNIKVYYNNDGKEEASTSLSDLWKELSAKTSVKKQTRFKDLMTESYEDFFEPSGSGGEEELCDVTGIEGKLIKTKDIKVLPVVMEQIKIGESLKNAESILISNDFREGDVYEPLKLGVKHRILHNSEKYSSIDESHVMKLNNTNFTTIKGNKNSYGFGFYGGNEQAIGKDDEYKTFDELAGESGFKRLGVLRMDVDNLGQIFIKGFKESKINLSVYSTLSNQLDLFFSGYLNEIRNKEEYRDWVNILYSGGDDIFAIGRWDKIIDFAEEVRNEFREFVCGREEISISAGIALVGGKFPISKAADLAGEAEDKAKSYGADKKNNKKATKNAVSIFGEVISWGEEFEFVKELSEDLADWLAKGVISKGVLQKFYVFRKLKNDGKQDWRWLSAYTFARQAKDANKGKEQIERLKNLFVTGKYHSKRGKEYHFETERVIDLLCVASRWADFKNRK